MAMLGKQLKALGSAIRSNVWFLEGIEPNTGKVLRVIFIGGGQQKEYIERQKTNFLRLIESFEYPE